MQQSKVMIEPLPKITGILLAGGKSSRMVGDKGTGQDKEMGQDKEIGQDEEMGQDKGLILDKEQLRGKGKVHDKDKVSDKGMIRLGKFLMYQYPLKVLESLCDEILISTCNPMKIEEDYEQVCDKIPGIGPIGGVVTCLEKSSNDLNIILSYDLPLVNRLLFIELLKYSEEAAAVILPAASPDRPEPLCGIYRKSAATTLQKMIDQKIYAMHKVITLANTKIIPVDPSLSFYHDRLFKNINTESDLSELPEHLR